MRTIKFRAWYKGEKYPLDEQNLEDYEKPRMIYDVQNAYDGGGFVDEFNGLGYVSAFSSFMDEENFVLMQYTGLKDKNGKEIYEGDVVSLTERTINGGVVDHTCKVIQSKNGAWRLGGHPNFSSEYTTKRELYSERNRIEVIGNIYENPELLEQSNEDN